MSISSKLLVTAAALVVGITACSAAPASEEEAQGSTTSKLLAPQPSVMSAASAETTAKYGITYWSGGILASLPSYTGQSPFDAGAVQSTIADVLSSPYVSGGGCDITRPFGDGALANILGSFANGDCSYDLGGGSPLAALNASDLSAFGGFGGDGY